MATVSQAEIALLLFRLKNNPGNDEVVQAIASALEHAVKTEGVVLAEELYHAGKFVLDMGDAQSVMDKARVLFRDGVAVGISVYLGHLATKSSGQIAGLTASYFSGEAWKGYYDWVGSLFGFKPDGNGGYFYDPGNGGALWARTLNPETGNFSWQPVPSIPSGLLPQEMRNRANADLLSTLGISIESLQDGYCTYSNGVSVSVMAGGLIVNTIDSSNNLAITFSGDTVTTRTASENIAAGFSPTGEPLGINLPMRDSNGVAIEDGTSIWWKDPATGRFTYYQVNGKPAEGKYSAILLQFDGQGEPTYYESWRQQSQSSAVEKTGNWGTPNVRSEVLSPGLANGTDPNASFSTELVDLTGVPNAPGWQLRSTISRSELLDPEGAPVLVTAPGDSLVRNPDSGVFTLTRPSGVKEYYDPITKTRIFQSADGSGVVLQNEGADQTNFAAGQLTIDADGSFTVTPTGQPSLLLFQTSNSIDVTTNTDLSTTQSGSGDPQNVSSIEQGTAWGDLFGPFWAGLDPFVLNFNQDIMSSVMGDTATGGYRPGDFNLSPVGDTFDDIDYWYDYQSDLTMLMLEQQIGKSYLREAASYLLDSGYQVTWWPADPLVLDLNGDGVRLASFHDHPVSFDIDHDGGSKEDTGWVAANTIKTGTPPAINTDGIVVQDLNSNGIIDDISETLSEYYNGTVGTGGNAGTKPFANGFAALKSLDSNNDNIFNSSDAAWGSLRVWVDDNADGVSFKDVNGNGTYQAGIDTSELKTFAELGITSVNLANTAQSGLVNGGNEILATGNFVIGGQTREAQAANFLANPNGHSFIDQQNGTNTGTKIATQGDGGGTTSYVSHAATGEVMDAAALGVRNLYGGAGNDTLTGDANDNWLSGSLGSDTFNAGAGDDVLLIDASDLQANIHAGSGTDLAIIVGDAGVTLNLAQAEVEIAQGGRGNDIFIGAGRSSVFIRGGDGSDIITGGSANDALSGEDGDDFIDGGLGNDLIRGHRGRDALYGGAGDDILDGGMEDDAVSGGTGNDVLKGGQGDDMLDGGDGIDLAEFAGVFADYRITKIDATTYRVVDTKAGRDGADTLKNIEKISFADVSAVDITLDNPLPVKDVITIADRNGAKLISVAQLLANDIDWQGDVLHITTISDVKGGTIAGTVGGNGEITPTINANGELTFTPDPAFTGVMSFKYKIADVDGTPSATALQVGTTNAAEMRGQVFIKTPDMPTDPVFTDQWYLTDINVIPVWKDYTGKGVRIGQFEPSGPYAVTKEILEYRHADLQPNVDLSFLSDKNNVPGQDFSEHATLVAGVMVAARNGDGAVGVAYNAKIAGWQIGDTITVNSPTSVTADFANLYKLKDYDVSNNSWGFAGTFENFATATPPVAEEFFKPAVLLGRGGFGANIVMAGGNSRQTGGNTNYSETTNNRFVITTGAINAQGDISTLSISQTPFSNPGASILISAPGSNVATTSRILMNDQGTVFGTDTANVEGTSFATPIISGVVALMLEANPNLGWRDVQQILALSARNVNDASTDWTYNAATNWNGGGMHASHDYGFGDVDARAAVRLAETWTGAHTSYNERHLSQAEGSLATGGSNLGVAIADGAVLTRTLSIGAGIRAEHVDITIDLNHSNWGDLKVELISPSGTVSKMMTNPETTASNPGGTVGIGQLKYTFDTTHSYGELAQGNWQLRITDRSGRGVGTLNGWKVDVYGSDSNETINSRDLTPGETPVISATGNNTYFYTDEFATAPGSSRATLTDANGGTDIINAAAVSTNSTINLNNGSTSTIAGRNLTINGNVEFAFGGDGNDTLTGNAFSNRLQGGRGNDTLNGGDSLDLLDGGRGNDTLNGGAGIDYFVIRKDAGSVDTITDFSPSTVAEKILFVGFDNVTDFTQVTVTQEGANTRLNLGDGQSVLLQNLAPSQITEQNFGFFSDGAMLEKFANYMSNVSVFGGTSGVENGLLPNNMGDMRYFALGGDDVIGARTTNDLVDGGDGNDTIWGDYPGYTVNPGADWLEGGAGNDTLRGGAGDDLLLGGSGSDNLQGEAGNDVLRGASGADQITGGDGNDLLLGGVGDDYLDGGNGDDVIFLEGDFGTVNGTNFGFFGTRVGGAGADVLKVTPNGGGNSGFWASGTQFSAFNLVADFNPSQAGEMIDLSALTWIRGFGDLKISNLTVNGVAFARVSATSGTQQLMINLRGVTSSQLNATHFKFTTTPGLVFGGAGNDTLTGDAGGNTIDGGAGADNTTGRTGDDTFIVDNLGDVVNELPGGGFDTVQSSVSYTLPADVENLVLTGATATNGTGNANSNRITGNSGNNVLDGQGGADTLIGGAGSDTYIVDDQADTILENPGEGTDSVQSSVSFTLGNNIENLTLTGTDRINATGNAFNNVLTGNAADNILDGAGGADTMAGGVGDDTYYVDNAGDVVAENVNEGIDTVYSGVNYTLGANVEGLALYGSAVTGIGNALDNILSGNALNNTLNGGAGNDFLDGGAGADTLIGGTGDDFYVVDNAGDVVTENASEGIDTVQSSIGFSLASLANVENVTLTGSAAISATGNGLDNRLVGNDGANVLDGGAGNDFLDGGAGADTMIGGAGNDTYVVNDTSDTITESSGGGTDTVLSSIGYTLGTNLENLTLSGIANISGTGNTANNILTGNSGSNTLTGNAGDDVLDGWFGADTLIGGTGNDTYVVDNAGDVVTENAAEGTDLVQSSITYTLGANLENLTLTGALAINGTGNALDNVLTGNSAANVLTGGSGNDTLNGEIGDDTLRGGIGNDSLSGSLGADRFWFNEFGAANADGIQDFASALDKIVLDSLTFTALAGFEGSSLSPENFRAAPAVTAQTPTEFVLYDTANGSFFYDADGSGTGAAQLVATLSGIPALAASDILVSAYSGTYSSASTANLSSAEPGGADSQATSFSAAQIDASPAAATADAGVPASESGVGAPGKEQADDPMRREIQSLIERWFDEAEQRQPLSLSHFEEILNGVPSSAGASNDAAGNAARWSGLGRRLSAHFAEYADAGSELGGANLLERPLALLLGSNQTVNSVGLEGASGHDLKPLRGLNEGFARLG